VLPDSVELLVYVEIEVMEAMLVAGKGALGEADLSSWIGDTLVMAGLPARVALLETSRSSISRLSRRRYWSSCLCASSFSIFNTLSALR
jgi:hypothetical protein